jgi:hypothetical protein
MTAKKNKKQKLENLSICHCFYPRPPVPISQLLTVIFKKKSHLVENIRKKLLNILSPKISHNKVAVDWLLQIKRNKKKSREH